MTKKKPIKKTYKGLPKVERGEVFSGEFEACGHTVSWSIEIPHGIEADDEMQEVFAEDAEERAREMIAEDYTSGQLCTCWRGEFEAYGWWNIERDNSDK